MHMEEVSSDSQDDEDDRGMRSQPGHSFNNGANFHLDQIFTDKKELKMLLDAAAVRQCFDYYLEKNCSKFLKAKCLSHGCGWLLRAMKYETSCRFRIYKYVRLHTCGVEHATRRHKRLSSELIASLCVNHFRHSKGPSISEIQRIVFKELHCHASYWMCWKGSVIAKNIIRGTLEHEYACLPAFSHMSCTPWTLHGYLAENLRVNQHCGKYRYLFYAAAKAYTVDEFSEHFVELKNNSPEAIHVLENVLGFEKWSRAHFSGNRYDVITTNIVESLNSVLMDEREYPVSYIFNSIARKFSEKFRERHAFVDGQNNIFMPCAERILKDNKSASDSLYVTNTNGGLDQFTVFGSGITATVNFLERSCSGKKFNLVKISCEHAMAALRAKYGDGVGYGNSIYKYSSLIYKA
ncbi:hypothetical protein FXO38_30234 [Capsicum annuum]|nr:hypothetical protein FXO38_30234 [Capsicum annuum]